MQNFIVYVCSIFSLVIIGCILQCPKQDNDIDCGYYVGIFMEDILLHGQTKIPIDVSISLYFGHNIIIILLLPSFLMIFYVFVNEQYLLTSTKETYSCEVVEKWRHRWVGFLWNRFLKRRNT